MNENFEIKYLMKEKIELEHRVMKLEEQMKRQFENNRTMVDIIDSLREKDSFLYKKIYEVNEKNKTGLSFKEASILCKEGKKLRRSGWNGSNVKDAYLYFSKNHDSPRVFVDDLYYMVLIKYEDIINDDWEII